MSITHDLLSWEYALTGYEENIDPKLWRHTAHVPWCVTQFYPYSSVPFQKLHFRN